LLNVTGLKAYYPTNLDRFHNFSNSDIARSDANALVYRETIAPLDQPAADFRKSQTRRCEANELPIPGATHELKEH
jgi:hypothetical protein